MRQMNRVTVSETSQSATQHIVHLDTDIGDDIDDAFALVLLLQSPELNLQGVSTVFGDTRRRTHLAAHLLKLYGRADIPVAAGIGTPLQPRQRPSGVPQAALLDEREAFLNLPNLSPLSGPELLIQNAQRHAGKLTLLCIGPLTNIAIALQQEPHLFMAIRSIILMGGTSGLPLAEWNMRSDVKAAQIVLGSGIPITMIGMNVTMHCQLKREDVQQIRNAQWRETQFLSRLIGIWQRHRPRWHPAMPYLHDPLTIAALCNTEFFQFEEMPVRLFNTGYMVPRLLNGPQVRAATSVQAEQARLWIMQRLLQPARQSRQSQAT